MTLYDLLVSISLDTSAYDKGMDASSQKAHSFGDSVKNGFGKLAKIGTAAVGAASAAVAAFGGASVKTGMEFDKAMSQVAATMGKSMDEMEKEVGEVDLAWGHFSGNLREYAQEMGKNTAFSASQAADALNYMALAGYDTQKSMEMLPNVLNLAAAGGMELATASDMITDASSALGLTQEQTNAMVDQMAAASAKANTSVEQLGAAMLTVGGTAKVLKGGTTELSTALGILADNGVKGAEGGTALRNILSTIQGSKFEKTFGEMGISAYDAQGNLRSLKDVFLDMNEAMAGMTDEEKTKIINATFNARDLKNVNALLGTQADRWDELSAAIGDSAGSAQKMADTQLDNLAGDITLMKSAIEGAQIAVSDKLSPSLRGFVQEGSKGISKFTDLLSGGDFAGAIESIGGTLAKLTTMALEKVPTLISAGGQLLKGLGDGLIKEAPSLITNLGTMFVSGFSSLADMIVSSAPVIADKIPELLNAVVARFETISSAMITIGTDMISQLGQGLVEGIPNLLENVLPMILQFTEFLRANAGTLIDTGLEFITNLAQGIINSIPVLIAYVPQIITNLANIINDNAPKILVTGVNIIKNLAMGLVQAIPVIVSHIPQILQAIWSVFMAFNWVNIGTNIITFIRNGLQSIGAALPEFFNGLWEKVFNTVTSINWAHLGSSLINLLVSGITKVATLIPKLLLSIARLAVNMFRNVNWAGVGKTVITLLWGAIKGAGHLIWTVLKTIGKKGWEAFKKIDWKGVGKTVITFIGNAIKGAGHLIWNGLKTIGKKGWDAFKKIDWLGLGSNIISGIVKGIGGAAGRLFGKLRSLASDALGAAKKALGISSPSKVFEKEVGKNIMLGWAKGIDENASVVEDALSNANKGMMDAFTPMTDFPLARDVEVSAQPLDINSDSPVGTKNVTINNYITVDGAEKPQDFAVEFVRTLKLEMRSA